MTARWTAEPPEDERPALPVTNLLLSGGRGERQPGAVLEQALARARADEAREEREAVASAPDPDERAAALVARGYSPGMFGDLSRRLGDTLAELEGEREKIERSRRRSARVMRDHAAGRITVADIARMDLDEGDEGKVERLERRAASLQRQLEEASALVAQQRDVPEDPVEAATRRAHEAFAEATRARLAEAQAARPHPREPRPFAGAGAAPAREADCEVCSAARALEAQRGGGLQGELDRYDAEITRLVDAGYSLATAQIAATPAGYR